MFNVSCPPLKIAVLISLDVQRLRRAPAQTQSITGFQALATTLNCQGRDASSMFYRSPEACSGARCSVAPPANERQMQDLGALALPWSRRLGRLDVHPCRDDPSSPKSHLQSPGCSLFDLRGCSGTVRAAFLSLSLSLVQLQLL
jgi:hypothetical protein